jgi:predicted DNA-binding transcriptional regulator AlpA
MEVVVLGEYIHPREASEISGFSVSALAQMRHTGKGPRYYKPTSRTVLYKRSELIAWVESSVRISTGAYA